MWFNVTVNLWVKNMIFHCLNLCSASTLLFTVVHKLKMGFWVKEL